MYCENKHQTCLFKEDTILINQDTNIYHSYKYIKSTLFSLHLCRCKHYSTCRVCMTSELKLTGAHKELTRFKPLPDVLLWWNDFEILERLSTLPVRTPSHPPPTPNWIITGKLHYLRTRASGASLKFNGPDIFPEICHMPEYVCYTGNGFSFFFIYSLLFLGNAASTKLMEHNT